MIRYRFGGKAQDPATRETEHVTPVAANTGNQARTRIVQQQRRSQRTSRTWMMNKR